MRAGRSRVAAAPHIKSQRQAAHRCAGARCGGVTALFDCGGQATGTHQSSPVPSTSCVGGARPPARRGGRAGGPRVTVGLQAETKRPPPPSGASPAVPQPTTTCACRVGALFPSLGTIIGFRAGWPIRRPRTRRRARNRCPTGCLHHRLRVRLERRRYQPPPRSRSPRLTSPARRQQRRQLMSACCWCRMAARRCLRRPSAPGALPAARPRLPHPAFRRSRWMCGLGGVLRPQP